MIRESFDSRVNGMNSFPFFTSRSVFFFGSAIIVIRLGIRFFLVYSEATGYGFVLRATSRPLSLVGEYGISRTFCADERTSPVAAADAAIRKQSAQAV